MRDAKSYAARFPHAGQSQLRKLCEPGRPLPGPELPRRKRQYWPPCSNLWSAESCYSGPGGELWAVNDRFAEMFGVEAEKLREAGNLEQLVEKVAPQFADSDDGAARWRQRFRSGEAFLR